MKRKYKKNYKKIKENLILVSLLVFIFILVYLSIVLVNYLKTIDIENKITSELSEEYEQATNIKVLTLNGTDIRFNTANNILYTLKDKEITRYNSKSVKTLPDSIYNLKLPLELNDKYPSAYIKYTDGIMTIYFNESIDTYLSYSFAISLNEADLISIFELKECDVYTLNESNDLYIDKYENLNLVTSKDMSIYNLKKLNKLSEDNYDRLLNICTVSNRISTKTYELLKLYNSYTFENYIAYLSNTGNSQFIVETKIINEIKIEKK